MTKENKINLKVAEALQDDVHKGIVRIDSEIMRDLGIRRGDVISIKGSRETVAIADRSYPADVGEGLIRIDGILRRNAKTGIGDNVCFNTAVKHVWGYSHPGNGSQTGCQNFVTQLLDYPVYIIFIYAIIYAFEAGDSFDLFLDFGYQEYVWLIFCQTGVSLCHLYYGIVAQHG